MPPSTDSILQALDDAFPDRGWPADQPVVPDVDYREGPEVEAWLRPVPFWKDLRQEDLVRNYDFPPIMTPAALAWYLPAFMRVAWTSPEEADMLPCVLLHIFEDNFGGLLDLLPDSALECVTAFIEDPAGFAQLGVESECARALTTVQRVLNGRRRGS